MNITRIPGQLMALFKIAAKPGVNTAAAPGKQKSFPRRLAELLYWYLRYGEVLNFYYILGFQSKSWREMSEYMSWRTFDKVREKTNRRLVKAEEMLDYRVLTFDKYLANNYLESISVPTAHNEGIIHDNTVFWTSGEQGSLESILARDLGILFFKPIFGMGGQGILRLTTDDGVFVQDGKTMPVSELEKLLSKDIWVIQKKIMQHPELDKFNASGVNTIRIITMLNQGKPGFLASFLRISIGNSHIDNWDSGSLALGIEHEDGTLWADGFYRPRFASISHCLEHPDSKIPFKGFKIPFYKEAVDISLRAHRFFYGRFIMTWDYAITPEGPVIIEINCRPTFQPLQMWYGGLKKQIMDAAQYYKQKSFLSEIERHH